MVARRRRNKPRQEISICTKKQIVRLRDADVPWAVVLRQLPIPITKDTGRRIMRSAAKYRAIVGSRARMHLDVICCISPHLERCTRHQDSSRRALRNICLHLVVIF